MGEGGACDYKDMYKDMYNCKAIREGRDFAIGQTLAENLYNNNKQGFLFLL